MAWAMKEILRSSQNARINSAVMNSLTKMLLLLHTNPIPTLSFGEQGMAQWWECSLPSSVARVQIPASAHMWVEFVVGSLLCSERFFSGYSGFPFSSKTNISKFQFDHESGRRRTTLWMCYLQIIIYLFIYLLSLYFYFIFNLHQDFYHSILTVSPLL